MITLAWFVLCLAASLGLFSRPDDHVGPAWRLVFGLGALAGLVLGVAVGWATRSAIPDRRSWMGVKWVAGTALLGAFGGGGGATIANGAHEPRPALPVELPIIDREIARGRSSGGPAHIVRTISPDPFASEETIDLTPSLWAASIPGRCLRAQAHTGLLGGAWLTDVTPSACANRRGYPADRIIADDEGWRWHPSAAPSRDAFGRWIDGKLPPGTKCRMEHPQAAVMRCRRLP